MTIPTAARSGWESLLAKTRGEFTAASFALFQTLVCGWVLAPGRRTITALICVGDPEGRHAHDAYHRFFRAGGWSLDALWRALVLHVVCRLCPDGSLILDLDDTLYKKSGRKIQGAGVFRDAVRSTRNKTVYATGLNLVVVTLRVSPPWGGMPIGVPVGVRLHRKGGPTTLDLAEQILQQLACWLPERNFVLCADGAYASLVARQLPRTKFISRIRRDAALYEKAPPKTGKRGRPRKKGGRLPTPAQIAEALADADFVKMPVDWRGQAKELMVWSTSVLWYALDKDHLVKLVVVRDPTQRMSDDFFCTSGLDADPEWVASHYAGRWSIECVNREVKQCLGAEDPQCWKSKGPERAASMSLWIYSAIWTWYIPNFGPQVTWTTRPWYPEKATPSFLDALAALRRCLWSERISRASISAQVPPKIIDSLIDVLARAA